MEQISFPAKSGNSLVDIIEQGFHMVSRETNQPLSEINYLNLRSEEKKSHIELRAKLFAIEKIKQVEVSLSQYPHPSFKTLKTLFKEYGSATYTDFTIEKSREERDKERRKGERKDWESDKKYGILISAFRWPPQNFVHLPEFLNKKDADNFCEFLDILRISYRRTQDSLEVKHSQWRNRTTAEAQALIYQKALEKGLNTSLYSSTAASSSRNQKNVFIKNGDGSNYVDISETSSYHQALKEEEILKIQSFIKEHLDANFPEKRWVIFFYSLKDHTPPRDYHKTRILSVAQ